MEEVSLTETESRYYGDLFLCCDEEKTGKIPMLKASELYRSANLSNEKILEITSLAGIPDTALHVSRVQFYSCLKLIAAHQASMPLRQELIAASVQLPLPRFSWTESSSNKMEMTNTYQQHHHTIPPPPVTDRRNSLKRLYEWSDSNALGSRRNSSATHQPEISAVNSDVPSTDSEVEQGESSCGGEEGVAGVSGHNKHHRRGVSPEAWSTNSDSPTPTNSVAERPWAKETLWHGLLGDEHRQLLGTEEESSDRHSSDDENETDLETVYQITPEQREYYFKQFKAVQHDPNGLLSGQVARVFFEKSRIPVEELRHIWQLCDVTRDGALSLAEFTAAMHLVVLRRNNIPLPATLPVCLHPNVLQHTALGGSQMTSQADPPEADLLHLDDDDEEDNTDNTIIGVNATINAAVAVGANVGVNVVGNSGGRGLNENNVMNISTLSTSSQASVSSRQGSNAITTNSKSLTPPPLPLKLHSISNSPKVSPPPLPLKLQSISNSPTGGGVNASTSSPTSNMWAKDVQPNQWTIAPLAEATEVTAPTSSPPPIMWAKDVQPNKWTKFNESPTSNVSSPGPKPVNFDMQRTAQAVVSDPQILHPVPLRVTPVAGGVITSTEKHNNDVSDGAGACVRESSPKSSSISSSNSHGSGVAGITQPHRDSLQNNDLRAIQRPQAKKLPIKNIGAIPPPPQREPITAGNIPNTIVDHDALAGIGSGHVNNNLSVSMVVNKKDPPPLPPPRPHRHGRSSSLDLNKFKIGTPSGPQPEIIAQASFDLQTSTGFADFTHFTDGNIGTGFNDIQPQQMHSLPPQNLAGRNIQTASGALPPTRLSLQSNQRVSAFEVYRKPNTPRNSQSPTSASGVPPIGPAPTPFGSVAATAMTTATALPNSELYEKRVNAISETLRHVSFKQEHNNNNMTEVLRHLREQNNLLLRLCNDLSDELLTVQTRKEEMRLKLEATSSASNTSNDGSTLQNVAAPTMAAVGHTGGVVRTGSSISAPVTANITGGSGSSGVHSNV